MQKAIRLAIALLFIFVLSIAQPAFAKSSHSSSASHHSIASTKVHRNSASHYSDTASSSSNKKFGNCDYPEQLDAAGRRCGNRAASVRAGGRLGGEL
ncbi:hypothetical protein IQ272_29635 [Chroococcidiopsidales cyanobacterium LEGE 13417]|nr:hypothetical protein [Chroococcidiopsidales cyanobacterium LEGE 13417]